MSKKTVCLDFDGVIHSYVSPWENAHTIPDPPVAGAFRFIQELLDNDFEVAVFSTRSHQLGGKNAMIEWFKQCGFENTDKLSFPQEKPPAVIYIDDRGFCFKGEWPTVYEIQTFRPWNR